MARYPFHGVLRRAAMAMPPLRRLVAERDAATAERSGVVRRTLDTMLAAARNGTFFRTTLNGVPLDLPVETLRTMVHCMHLSPETGLALWVETAHLNWMLERMAPGGTFLDVGASTGATALPAAARFPRSLRIVAYEPATAARGLLAATIERNAVVGIEVRPFAVADTAGEAIFREYLPDETGQTPWQPEGSSLMASIMSEAPSQEVAVRVVTLDGEMAELGGLGTPVIIKIDVEGFEVPVLRGAVATIAQYRPAIAIDIHLDPFGDGRTTTERAVRQFMEPLGYDCRMLDHVLLCAPGHQSD